MHPTQVNFLFWIYFVLKSNVYLILSACKFWAYESKYCGFHNISQYQVSNSNYSFSEIVGKYINRPLNEVYENVKSEYGVGCSTNPIVKYNHERLYYV